MEDSSTPRLRCPHCAGPLSKEMETSSWTVPPLVRDNFSMIGSAVGGTASAFYKFNHGRQVYVGANDLIKTRLKGKHTITGQLSPL